MADAGKVLPFAALRSALQRGVDQDGLRAIGRQIDLTPSSLLNLLRGGEPRASTRHRILSWYLQQVSAGRTELHGQLAFEAAAAMLTSIPAAERSAAARKLAHALRLIHQEHRQPIPHWLEVLDGESDDASEQ
jgi:hypothetical protein